MFGILNICASSNSEKNVVKFSPVGDFCPTKELSISETNELLKIVADEILKMEKTKEKLDELEFQIDKLKHKDSNS